jgi:hypothetical protein
MDEQLQMQHKKQKQGFLFLYALSQELKERAKAEGFDVCDFITRLSKFYQVRELKRDTIVDAFAVMNQFKYIIVLAHNNDDSLVLSDETHLSMSHLISLLPDDLQGSVLDFAICKSDSMAVVIKKKTNCEHVLSTKGYTDLKSRFLTYVFLPGYMKAHPKTDDYLVAYSSCLNEIKQKVVKKDLRPSTTKLGTETSENIKTSVFAPYYVNRDYVYKIQIYIHYRSKTGTFQIKAQGCDPETKMRDSLVTLGNLQEGDAISLKLSFKDAMDSFTDLICVSNENNPQTITIGCDIIKAIFKVKVSPDYPYPKFSTRLEITKDGHPLLEEPYEFDFYIKIESPSTCNEERPRVDIGGRRDKLVRESERVHLSGRPKESIFFNITDVEKQKWMIIFTEFLEKQNGIHNHDFCIEAKNRDYISMALVSFFKRWYQREKKIVSIPVNGSACFRFLIDCGISCRKMTNKDPQKRYGDFIRVKITQSLEQKFKQKNEVDDEVDQWFSEKGLNKEDS